MGLGTIVRIFAKGTFSITFFAAAIPTGSKTRTLRQSATPLSAESTSVSHIIGIGLERDTQHGDRFAPQMHQTHSPPCAPSPAALVIHRDDSLNDSQWRPHVS